MKRFCCLWVIGCLWFPLMGWAAPAPPAHVAQLSAGQQQWLAQHNEYYDLEGKRQRSQTDGVSAWIDPEGYRRWVAGKKRAFEDEVDLEMGVPNGK